MKLRIARKIYRRIGSNYPIGNTKRLIIAIKTYEKVCKRSFKEFKKSVLFK